MAIFLEILFGVCGLLLSLAAAFFGMGYYKQGKASQVLDDGNAKLNTNSLLKEQIDALEGKVDLQNEKMTEQSHEIEQLNKKIDLLTKEIEERDKKFAQVILTLQGENPLMTEFIKSANEYMMLSKPVMEDLREYLKKQVI